MKRVLFLALALLLSAAPAVSQSFTATWNWLWPDSVARSTFPNIHAMAIDEDGDIFVSRIAGDTSDGLYESRDQGKTFSKIPRALFGSQLSLSNAYMIWSVCATKSNSILVGADEEMFRSTDNGKTWNQVLSSSTERYSTIIRAKGDTVFAGGYNGIYRSTDNGGTWTNVYPNDPGGQSPHFYFVTTISIAANGYVYVGTGGGLGYSYGILRSTDGGNTWSYVNNGITSMTPDTLDWNANITSLAAVGDTVFAASTTLYRSTDNGASWQALSTRFYNNESGAMISTSHGLIVPTLNNLWLTTDCGETWNNLMTFQLPINVWSGVQYTDSTVLMGMWNGLGLLTLHATNPAPKIVSQEPASLDSVGVNTPYRFAVSTESSSGSVIYTWKVDGNVVSTTSADSLVYTFKSLTPQTTVSVTAQNAAGVDSVSWSFKVVTGVDESPNQPKSFSLSQNYPNPFNPTTTIEYRIEDREYTTLTVFNVLGQKITTLVDGMQSPGAHQVVFDGSRLPSGTYFYVIQAGNHRAVQKMMLIK